MGSLDKLSRLMLILFDEKDVDIAVCEGTGMSIKSFEHFFFHHCTAGILEGFT